MLGAEADHSFFYVLYSLTCASTASPQAVITIVAYLLGSSPTFFQPPYPVTRKVKVLEQFRALVGPHMSIAEGKVLNEQRVKPAVNGGRLCATQDLAGTSRGSGSLLRCLPPRSPTSCSTAPANTKTTNCVIDGAAMAGDHALDTRRSVSSSTHLSVSTICTTSSGGESPHNCNDQPHIGTAAEQLWKEHKAMPKERMVSDERMAELILTALQRKDDLLREQADSLRQRDLEVVDLQKETARLKEEKCLILKRLRDFSGSSGIDLVMEEANLHRGHPNVNLLCMQNKELAAQLSKARRDAEQCEAKYTAELQSIRSEMQELSHFADELQALRNTLRQTEKRLMSEREARKRYESRCAQLANEVQDAIRCEREISHQKQQEQEKLHEETKKAHLEATKKVEVLQIELNQLLSEHAALKVALENNEQRMSMVPREQTQLKTELQTAREEAAKLRQTVTTDPKQSRKDHEGKGHTDRDSDEFIGKGQYPLCYATGGHSGVPPHACENEVIQQLEKSLSESVARERLLSSERDRLRTQLQQLTVMHGKELLDQHHLANERARVQCAHLQELQQALENQKQQHEETQAKTQAELARSREKLQGALAELRQLKQERAAAAEKESHHRALIEGQMVTTLQSLREKLDQRNIECRSLKKRLRFLEENRKRLILHTSQLPDQTHNHHETESPAKHSPKPPVAGRNVVAAKERHPLNVASVTAEAPVGTHQITQAQLEEAVLRGANLEKKLEENQRKCREHLKDRKVLIERLEKLQKKQQEQVRDIEKQQRETLRKLESAHRKRMATASSAEIVARKRRELFIQRGVARVVAELMEFIQELEAHAVALGHKHRISPTIQHSTAEGAGSTPSGSSQIVATEKEDILRAACDEITRNFLGVNGGWDTLLQSCHSKCKTGGHFGLGKPIPPTMRKRVQNHIAGFFKLHLLGESPPVWQATGAAGFEGSEAKKNPGCNSGTNLTAANSRRCTNAEEEVHFREEPYNSESDGLNRIKETECSNHCDESLIDILMECVRRVFQL
uniref:Uncharacterized protein n=1 Tax=Trypanosoma congolense (strain IL3000) TaxID=1068625 RepID=G0UN65_TRYCI|nr:conserved hypothetical protein [Trypanosoma congolense IL3000]